MSKVVQSVFDVTCAIQSRLPRRRGLTPPNKSSSPPNRNMKHYKSVEYLLNLNVNPPAQTYSRRTFFWRRFWCYMWLCLYRLSSEKITVIFLFHCVCDWSTNRSINKLNKSWTRFGSGENILRFYILVSRNSVSVLPLKWKAVWSYFAFSWTWLFVVVTQQHNSY